METWYSEHRNVRQIHWSGRGTFSHNYTYFHRATCISLTTVNLWKEVESCKFVAATIEMLVILYFGHSQYQSPKLPNLKINCQINLTGYYGRSETHIIYVTGSGKVKNILCKFHQNWDFAIYNVWVTSLLNMIIYNCTISEPILRAVKLHVCILTIEKNIQNVRFSQIQSCNIHLYI